MRVAFADLVIFTSLKNHRATISCMNPFFKSHSKIILGLPASDAPAFNPMAKSICYYRVSTPRQGKSGLGLEAQKQDVYQLFPFSQGEIVKEFYEVESGSGLNRPKLMQAIRLCKKFGYQLIIAKIDRLARNACLVAHLISQGIRIVAADKPNASHLDLLEDAIRAERELIANRKRTKDALQEAKRRGVQLGTHGKVLAQINKDLANQLARRLKQEVENCKAQGMSEVRIMNYLNDRKIRSARGKKWGVATIHNLCKRIEGLAQYSVENPIQPSFSP